VVYGTSLPVGTKVNCEGNNKRQGSAKLRFAGAEQGTWNRAFAGCGDHSSKGR